MIRPHLGLSEFTDNATLCEDCGVKGRVLKGRPNADNVFRRRRICPDCGTMWFVREVRESPMKDRPKETVPDSE